MKIGIFDPGEFCASPKENFRARANQVLDDLLEIAPQVDKMGFTRYWLGEHYEGGGGWRNAEILIAILCGITESMRIGVAGVKMNLYNPLLVAQNFKMLEYLYSGRIDLGIARGGAPEKILQALGVSTITLETYEKKIRNLMGYFNSATNDILIPPYHGDRPQTWILATGSSSVPVAVELKLNFCFSIFHKHSALANSREILQDFRRRFELTWAVEPRCNIAVAGICASSAQKARRLEKVWQNDFFTPCVIGDPSLCEEKLLEIADLYQVDEIMFMSLCYDKEDRLECYRLLSERVVVNQTCDGRDTS